MTLSEVKSYLRIDGDDDDTMLEAMMEVAEEFITEACGRFDETKARARLVFLAVMQDLYENRTMTATSTQGYSVTPSMSAMIRSLLTQLQVEELEEESTG